MATNNLPPTCTGGIAPSVQLAAQIHTSFLYCCVSFEGDNDSARAVAEATATTGCSLHPTVLPNANKQTLWWIVCPVQFTRTQHSPGRFIHAAQVQYIQATVSTCFEWICTRMTQSIQQCAQCTYNMLQLCEDTCAAERLPKLVKGV